MTSLENAVNSVLAKVQKISDIECVQKKAIPYGVALYFAKGTDKNNLNIYFSQKKGVSFVLGGQKSSELSAILQKICGLSVETSVATHKWSKWLGTDESGKGDFFGPLVIAGFVVEKAMLSHLREIGVDDCKKLEDAKILQIAKILHEEYPANCKVFGLAPKNYNKIYQQFRQKGQKLNQMMIWLHTKAVLDLRGQIDFEGVVIDKFASNKALDTYAPAEFKEVPCIFREKAEDDPAVAAASILARAEFLRQMDFLSSKCGFTLHKGASALVKKDAKKFISKFSAEKLSYICKTHFKTYNEILS